MLYIRDVASNLSRSKKELVISIRQINKNLILHNFLFPVTTYIYINTEYWPEHSFNVLFTFIIQLSNFIKYVSFHLRI